MATYQRAIIVGASSGIGADIVRILAEQGCMVAAVARREDRLQALAAEAGSNVRVYAHDVQRFDEVPELFLKIVNDLGGLDLIVYASGVMPEVGPSEFNFEKDRQMVEVNLLGAIAWLNQAAIRFESTRSGTIVGIGSVAGDRGRQGQPVYNTTKAALATYLEALRNRLSRHGVRVVTIKPGPTETEMTKHLHLKGAMPSRKVAELVVAKAPKTGEHYAKLAHKVAFAIIRRIPSPIFRKLKI